MTFKCHKIEDAINGPEMYPVWAIQQNCRNDKWIATAGGEGKIVFWDLMLKNKIMEF